MCEDVVMCVAGSGGVDCCFEKLTFTCEDSCRVLWLVLVVVVVLVYCFFI